MGQTKKQPFFTVVITTFNREKYLPRALDSLFLQKETNFEILVIDDGSTDATSEILKNYKEKSNFPFRSIYKENGGSASAKNCGIKNAKGKYITFLDSDDEYAPIHLETRKKVLLKNPSIDLLNGGVKVIGEEYVPDRFDNSKEIHLSKCAISGTFFLRKEFAQKIEGFQKMPVGMDGEYYENVKKKGGKIVKTELPTYIYHHETEDSITNQLREKIKGN